MKPTIDACRSPARASQHRILQRREPQLSNEFPTFQDYHRGVFVKRLLWKALTVCPISFGAQADKHEFSPGLAENTNFSVALLFCPARSPIKTQKTRAGLRWFPSPLLGTDATYADPGPVSKELRTTEIQKTSRELRKRGQKTQKLVHKWDTRMGCSVCLCPIQMHMYPLYMLNSCSQLIPLFFQIGSSFVGADFQVLPQ